MFGTGRQPFASSMRTVPDFTKLPMPRKPILIRPGQGMEVIDPFGTGGIQVWGVPCHDQRDWGKTGR